MKKIVEFENDLVTHVRQHHASLLQRINREQELNDEVAAALKRVIEEFKASWMV